MSAWPRSGLTPMGGSYWPDPNGVAGEYVIRVWSGWSATWRTTWEYSAGPSRGWRSFFEPLPPDGGDVVSRPPVPDVLAVALDLGDQGADIRVVRVPGGGQPEAAEHGPGLRLPLQVDLPGLVRSEHPAQQVALAGGPANQSRNSLRAAGLAARTSQRRPLTRVGNGSSRWTRSATAGSSRSGGADADEAGSLLLPGP
jgi:hypothetical protein